MRTHQTRRPSSLERAEGAREGGAETRAVPRLAVVPAPREAPAGPVVVVFDERGRELARCAAPNVVAATLVLAMPATVSSDAAASSWLSLDQAIEEGVFTSRRTGREAVARGDLEASKSGRGLLFEREEVERYLRARRAPARPRKAPPATTSLDACLAAAGLGVRGGR